MNRDQTTEKTKTVNWTRISIFLDKGDFCEKMPIKGCSKKLIIFKISLNSYKIRDSERIDQETPQAEKDATRRQGFFLDFCEF